MRCGSGWSGVTRARRRCSASSRARGAGDGDLGARGAAACSCRRCAETPLAPPFVLATSTDGARIGAWLRSSDVDLVIGTAAIRQSSNPTAPESALCSQVVTREGIPEERRLDSLQDAPNAGWGVAPMTPRSHGPGAPSRPRQPTRIMLPEGTCRNSCAVVGRAGSKVCLVRRRGRSVLPTGTPTTPPPVASRQPRCRAAALTRRRHASASSGGPRTHPCVARRSTDASTMST
jgi:hypothetical protein